MKKIFLPVLIIAFISCSKEDFSGRWTAKEGPYVLLKTNFKFEFGIPNDPKPLSGDYKIKDGLAELVGKSKIVGEEGISTLRFEKISKDELKLIYINIKSKRFEMELDIKSDYGMTNINKEKVEYKMSDSIAQNIFGVYYWLTQIKFKKSI